jgi:hypothetical protein
MSRRNDDPARLKTGSELVDYAVRRGCKVRNGGRHTYVTAPNGYGCPVPTSHHGDLPEGTRRSIWKLYAAMGIALLLLALVSVAVATMV